MKVLLQAGKAAGESIQFPQWPPIANSTELGSTGTVLSHEPFSEYTWRSGSGTLSKLYLRVITNTRTDTMSMQTQIAGSAGNMIVTFATTETGEKRDDSNTDSIASGDTIQAENTDGGGGGSLTISVLSVQWLADSEADTKYQFANGEKTNHTSASVTRLFPIIGNEGTFDSTREASKQFRVRQAATFSKYQQSVFTNARTTDTTFRVRVNGSNGNQVLTFTSTETGHKEDATNSETLADGDLICYGITTGTGSESMEFTQSAILVTNSAQGFEMGVAGVQSIAAGGATEYIPVAGTSDVSTATEANVKGDMPFAFKITSIRGYFRTNGITADTFVRLRKNGSTLLSLTWASTETGAKEDTTVDEDIAADDELNWMLEPGGTGTTAEFGVAQLRIEAALTGDPLRVWMWEEPGTWDDNAISQLLIGLTVPFAASAGSLIKTFNGLATASVKTANALAIASVKTKNGLTNA